METGSHLGIDGHLRSLYFIQQNIKTYLKNIKPGSGLFVLPKNIETH